MDGTRRILEGWPTCLSLVTWKKGHCAKRGGGKEASESSVDLNFRTLHQSSLREKYIRMKISHTMLLSNLCHLASGKSLYLSGISTPGLEDTHYKAWFILHPNKITFPVDKVRNYKMKINSLFKKILMHQYSPFSLPSQEKETQHLSMVMLFSWNWLTTWMELSASRWK